MIVTCSDCNRTYDDVDRWTLCPHGPLGFPLDDYCPKCDTVKTIFGQCPHQESGSLERYEDG